MVAVDVVRLPLESLASLVLMSVNDTVAEPTGAKATDGRAGELPRFVVAPGLPVLEMVPSLTVIPQSRRRAS